MYCVHCGKELSDEAIVCPNCGCATDSDVIIRNHGGHTAANQVDTRYHGGHTAAKVFMVIGCILTSLSGALIPLCWTLPMTIIYFNRTNAGLKVGTGFKVCTLLFVSLIAGILMLCEDDAT